MTQSRRSRNSPEADNVSGMKLISIIATLFMYVGMTVAFGADDPNQREANPVLRTSYTGENAPTEVRLMVFLNRVTKKERQPQNKSNESSLQRDLQKGEFLESDYATLLVYFQDLSTRIESETDEGTWHIACGEQASQLNAVELRAVWNSLDDLRLAIYAKYAAIASGELAALGYVDFPEKLEMMGTSFISITYDYRDTESVPDDRLIEGRPGFCEALKTRMVPVPN